MRTSAQAVARERAPRHSVAVPCPVCDQPPALQILGREQLAEELALRDRFFASRLAGSFSRAELRDVTNMLLALPADIHGCEACGVLVRGEAPGEDAFRDDRYNERVLQLLHETHREAFDAKEEQYRPLLESGSRVVEIGSYVGGFLSAARDWGWAATGLDIGRDIVSFSRARGFDARCSRFEDAWLERGSLDAVFIWNCFEQLAACRGTLNAVHEALRAEGLLLIRIPDASFYLHHEASLRRGERESSLHALAYNALLGWPHRFGYTLPAARTLAEQHGFALERVIRAPAIRPLRNAMLPPAQAEEAAVNARRAFGWMEILFRNGARRAHLR
jgi:hypothetical protein